MQASIAIATAVVLVSATALGLRTGFRVQRFLARQLWGTHEALGSLGLASVMSAEDHQAVQEVFDRVAVTCTPLARAWTEFDETLVWLDGRPRSTRAAGEFLYRDLLRDWQNESGALLLREPVLLNWPNVLVRLGLLGSLVALSAAIWEVSALVGSVGWAGAASGAFATTWLLPVPAVLGLAASMPVRWVLLRWSAGLDASLGVVVTWLDTHYRAAVSEEILVRLLRTGEAILQALDRSGSRPG